MNDDKNNDQYRLIVIIGAVAFLLWGAAEFQQKIHEFSKILGFIAGPIFLYLIYKTIKAIWPNDIP